MTKPPRPTKEAIEAMTTTMAQLVYYYDDSESHALATLARAFLFGLDAAFVSHREAAKAIEKARAPEAS